jgi:hypothetical protein
MAASKIDLFLVTNAPAKQGDFGDRRLGPVPKDAPHSFIQSAVG